MTTLTTSIAGPTGRAAAIAPILLAGFAGLALIYVAGFAQAASAHGPAHDQRHAIAFPCH